MKRAGHISLLISTLMVAASIAAILARPDVGAATLEAPLLLEITIPKRFGEWREQPFQHVVNPQAREILDKLYSETVSRTYVNSAGYVIMLAAAYGRDQRGNLAAHMPEVCYPANGFTLHRNEAGQLSTPFGEIPVRRLLTSRGVRHEPVIYWFTFGVEPMALDDAERRLRRRLIELRYAITGRVPDGLLFRVSSIDRDHVRANQAQEQFVNDLLVALSPLERKRLVGL